MIGRAQIRRRLDRLIKKTEPVEGMAPTAWWESDRADKRRAKDDVAAGRAALAAARDLARDGLLALEKNDEDAALSCAWQASAFYIEALETFLLKVRPSERSDLTRPARRRGRPRKIK